MCLESTQKKKRCEWTQAETVSLCHAWPKNYAKLKKASTKAKNQIWMEIFAEFINTTESEKELNQVKTKTRALEKEFKELKLRMSRTGEEGADKIKEKMKDTFDLIDEFLSERDSIEPTKMAIISSGIESDNASFMTDDIDESENSSSLSSPSPAPKSRGKEKRPKRKASDDKDDVYKLLRLSVDNQTKNNQIMIEAASELKTGMIEQATVLVNGFKDVMKSLMENKK